MTTIYVAGKYHEAARARALMEKLRALGHTITYDWTKHFFEEQAGIPQNEPKCAEDDMAGVVEANVFVILYHPQLSGGMCELGGAIVMQSDIIAVGFPKPYVNVFLHHPAVRHVATDDDVPEALKSSPFFYEPAMLTNVLAEGEV